MTHIIQVQAAASGSKSGPKLVSIDFFGSQEPVVSRKKSQPRSHNSALEKLAKKAEERDQRDSVASTSGNQDQLNVNNQGANTIKSKRMTSY